MLSFQLLYLLLNRRVSHREGLNMHYFKLIIILLIKWLFIMNRFLTRFIHKLSKDLRLHYASRVLLRGGLRSKLGRILLNLSNMFEEPRYWPINIVFSKYHKQIGLCVGIFKYLTLTYQWTFSEIKKCNEATFVCYDDGWLRFLHHNYSGFLTLNASADCSEVEICFVRLFHWKA
jgi:hypothetical protein